MPQGAAPTGFVTGSNQRCVVGDLPGNSLAGEDDAVLGVGVVPGEVAGVVAEDAVALRQEVGIEPATIEAFGNPAEQVAEVARRERVSLLVVGSRGLGGARRLGSVGERLAHEARCSVLVARPA